MFKIHKETVTYKQGKTKYDTAATVVRKTRTKVVVIGRTSKERRKTQK